RVQRPRAQSRWRRARAREQLDAHAVAREVDRAQVDAPEPEQRVARLARDAQLVLVAEAQAVAVEVEGAVHVRDADADVGEPLERDHAGRPSAGGAQDAMTGGVRLEAAAPADLPLIA